MVHSIKYLGIALFMIAFSCVSFSNDEKNTKQAFDPNAIAAAETKMWRAYYTNSPQQLTATLGQLLKTQFHLSPQTAQSAGNDFARVQ